MAAHRGETGRFAPLLSQRSDRDLARLERDRRELLRAQDEGSKAWQRVKELKRSIRKWHASSRAWFLEPLPKEFGSAEYVSR